MNNFLKSECYKVSHRAYPYTLLIIGVVIAILINVSVWYAIHVIRIPFTIEGADIMNIALIAHDGKKKLMQNFLVLHYFHHRYRFLR